MNAHFIDIDIIIKSDSKPWIIDKSNPNIPIMKIDTSDFNLFKSGILRSQNNKINFNGKEFWLSTDFMNNLKIKSKKYKFDISNLGISMQEFLNPDVIENINYDLDLSIFNKIINTNDDIYIICSKNIKSNFGGQISKLEESLEKIGLKIKKYYYITETFYYKDRDKIAYLKSKLLIQHLLGLKTDGDVFTEESIENYNQITFYDDDSRSVQMCKEINSVLEKLLIKTESNIKILVKSKIKNDDNFIVIKEYTGNKSNRFNEYNVQLEYSNIIQSFEGFRGKLY